MSCDHNVRTDTKKKSQYCLVYHDTDLQMAGHTRGQTSSRHTTETLSTPQKLIDRGLALGLTFTTNHLIGALEDGVTLPQSNLDSLLAVVWNMDYDIIKRMEALGYTK